jgi:serine/threonine protein kinase
LYTLLFENLDPDIVLGHGASGIVIKGTVRNETVAVKVLKWKTGSELESFRSFLDEINVMTSIEVHEFIVRSIGSSTEHIKRGIVYLFMEYCSLGSLEGFLRSNRDIYHDLVTNDKFGYLNGESEAVSQGEVVTAEANYFSSKHLISWSYQITKGMEYLKINNVTLYNRYGKLKVCLVGSDDNNELFQIVHGDLATRNVLLASRDNAKICDFGLANKMVEYNSKLTKSNRVRTIVYGTQQLYDCCRSSTYSY